MDPFPSVQPPADDAGYSAMVSSQKSQALPVAYWIRALQYCLWQKLPAIQQ